VTLVLPAQPTGTSATRSRTPAIEIRRLSKRYPVQRRWAEVLRRPLDRPTVPAIVDLTLEVGEGSFFGLLGPNGAGKTTLFKILSSLVLPDVGEVRVAGFDVVKEAAAVRQVLAPVIADERSLNWRLSARENLRTFAALHGLKGATLHRRIEEVLETVELTDTGEKLAGQFSSGMRQRLLIARAVLSRPRILLLDEPTRSLDPVAAARFRRFLRDELTIKHGCTVLLATHNAEEALELCERVGVLHRGRMLRMGTPQQLEAEFRDEDYRLWVRASDLTSLTAFAGRYSEAAPAVIETEGEWVIVQVRLRGGPERIAALIQELSSKRIGISRIEPLRLTVAELIERVIQRSGREGKDV
jgi:ABC-2 type transport system ATP-binding protein